MCGSVPGIIWLRCLVQRPQRCFIDVPRRSYRHIWSCSCVKSEVQVCCWTNTWPHSAPTPSAFSNRDNYAAYDSRSMIPSSHWCMRLSGSSTTGWSCNVSSTQPLESYSTAASRTVATCTGTTVAWHRWRDPIQTVRPGVYTSAQNGSRIPGRDLLSADLSLESTVQTPESIYELLALASLTLHEYTVNIRRTRVAVPDRLLGTLFGLKNKALSLSDFRNQLERLYFSSIVHRADSRRFYSYHAIYIHTQYCIPVLVIIQPTLSRIKRCIPSVCPIDWLIDWAGFNVSTNTVQVIRATVFTGHKTQPTGKAVETSNFVEP